MSDNMAAVLCTVAIIAGWGWSEWLDYRQRRASEWLDHCQQRAQAEPQRAKSGPGAGG